MKTFKPFTVFILETRIDYFWSAFVNKIFIGWNKAATVFSSLSLASLMIEKRHFPKGLLTLFSIFLITPMVGYILFRKFRQYLRLLFGRLLFTFHSSLFFGYG
jgi:hypothetical protein